VSYSHKFLSDTIGFEAQPESHISNDLLDTCDIPADGVNLLAFEFATVLGSASLQGEWISSWVSQRGGPDVRFWGAYAEASYFLTGEHRGYRRSRGSFYRVKLKETFSPIERGTWGAFEVAGRYSYLDLSDRNIRGGTENNVSLGLNWWLYSNFRIMTNWVHANLNGVDREDIWQMRFALEF
jgi:phosphate-selective porin OprO/OprP